MNIKLVGTLIYSRDNYFKIGLQKKSMKLEQAWHNSNLLNAIRRRIEPEIVRVKWKIGIKNRRPLRLHLGCGNQHIEGCMNIDFRKTNTTDLVCNIVKLPYPDNSVESIETYHVVEHIPRHDLPKALKEWHRILTLAGKLIIECPDFDEDVREYMGGNEKLLDSIFGLQRFPGDSHLFGYNFKRLQKLLKDTGFTDIQRKDPQDYHAKNEPCLRVECIKGNKP